MECWDEVVGRSDAVRRAFENIPALIAAFEGPEHRYVAMNAALRDTFPKATLGAAMRDLFPELEGQNLLEVCDRVYRTGETQHAHQWRMHIDLDGSGTLREVFFDVVVTARLGADDTVEGIQLMVNDLTARVRERMAAQARAEDIAERYADVRNSAIVMQRSLLAASVPVLPGADIAAEYLVAADDTEAGGDWFDAIPGAAGALLLVVGDVVGHGVEAATVMAQLRTATRLELLAGKDIAETLSAVDDFSHHVPGSKMTTLCIARLDTTTGVLEYATAGHPPPLLIRADGTAQYAEPSGAGALGSGLGFRTRTETLGVGDAVLLYSDGLIERPGRPVSASTAEFADLAGRIFAGAGFPLVTGARLIDRLCSQTSELLLRSTGYSDDVTLLAAQRRRPPPPLHLTVDADVHAARSVRVALRNWLSIVGSGDDDCAIIVHAVSEFVENAAEHGYASPRADGIDVDAALDRRGYLRVSVTDHGRWKPPSTDRGTRGRGLALAEILGSEVRVVGGDAGTTATVTYRLTHPARVVSEPNTPPVLTPARANADFRVWIQHGRLLVSGDIDNATAPTLASHIGAQSCSLTVPLIVDLSAVTHLGSAGVTVLAEAWDRSRSQGTDFSVITPPGCPAHHVLMLMHLPITTTPAPPPEW